MNLRQLPHLLRQRRFAEPGLVILAGLVLAAIICWPELIHAGTTVPHDLSDSLAQAYLLSWPGHILTTSPSQLWNSNTFFPAPDSFAFGDTFLGYAPFSFLGHGEHAALLRLNLLSVGVRALAFIGGYALIRQLGSHWVGATLAGVAFGFAPWTYAHPHHLNVLSIGGIALALAALCRGHGFSLRDGFRPENVRPGWVLAGWIIAAWQMTIGFAIGLPFFYVMLGLLVGIGGAAIWHRVRTHGWPLSRKAGISEAAGFAVFGLTSWLMARPSLRVSNRYETARRSVAELGVYSPPWRGFFTAPADSGFWGEHYAHARLELAHNLPYMVTDEAAVLPGFTLMILATAGLFYSRWRPRYRIILALAAAVSAVLAMGVKFAGGTYSYMVLYHLLPGWSSMRTPGRLVLWTVLLLAALAAGFLTRAADELLPDRAGRRRLPLRALIVAGLLVPALLATVEGTSRSQHPTVPRAPIAFDRISGPALILPSDYVSDTAVMFWSVDGFPTVANGTASLMPPAQEIIRTAGADLPDPGAARYLWEQGIRTVIVLRDGAIDTRYAHLLTQEGDGVTVTRQDSRAAVTFRLHEPPRP